MTPLRTCSHKKNPGPLILFPVRLHPYPHSDTVPHSVLAVAAAFTRHSLKPHPARDATATFTRRSPMPHPAYDAWLPHPLPRSILHCATHPISNLTLTPTHIGKVRCWPAGRLRWVRAVSGGKGATATHGVGAA
jgi:hypothetical protein